MHELNSSEDYSDLKSENQSAYWKAGRGTVEDFNVAQSVAPPLFGCDIMQEILEIDKRR